MADYFISRGDSVTVIDNFDDFYDPKIKRANVSAHLSEPRYKLIEADIRDAAYLEDALVDTYDTIIHLAARAGVRPSIERPQLYDDVNIRGTHNLLVLARSRAIKQFVFASSSSVYGVNPNVPWREDNRELLPISPYASTKISGELLGHVYSHLYGVRFLALRFFTVYGPRQRPDLAIHKFARSILAGRTIPVFGDGSTRRDYTYIDDIVGGIVSATHYTGSQYEIFNLGNSSPVTLAELLQGIELVLGKTAIIERQPLQPGDVPQTWGDVTKATRLLGYEHPTRLIDGLREFAAWLGTDQASGILA